MSEKSRSNEEQNETKTGYDNLEIARNLEALEEIRHKRAEIALSAARHIIETQNGETTDSRLYYAAMFGRSYEEGIYEHDQNLKVPIGIMHKLSDPKQEGQPLLIRAVEFPENNVDVGVLASFSEDKFEPARFEVEIKEDENNFSCWQGALAIAMRKVVPSHEGNEEYKISDEITKMMVCETATWAQFTGVGGLEIFPRGTGGVEIGENVHRNSKFGKKYHDKLAFWLRQHLAPTKRLELDDFSLTFRDNIRASRIEEALTQGISESEIAARSLSPTIASFFRTLEAYAGADEPEPIDVQAVFKEWRRDPYDAQSLFAELEIRDLVEEKEDQIVLSAIGRAVLSLIMEGKYE